MIEAIGEDALRGILSDFSCSKNKEIEMFVKDKALDFAQKKISITHCEENKSLLNFYQNENNRFYIFGERYSDVDNTKYIQLLRFF